LRRIGLLDYAALELPNVHALRITALLAIALVAGGNLVAQGVLAHKPSPSPALVPGVRGVRAIAVGSSHMIALTETGSVITWGNNGFGSLGRPKDEHVPGVVPSVTNVQSICAPTPPASPASRAAAS
jgi:hypothetical protein